MAVTSVVPLFEDQTGEWSRKASHTYTSAYHCQTDDIDDGPETVMGALGLSVNDTYAIGNDSDPLSFLQKATPTRVPGKPTLWKVVANWGPATSQKSDGSPTDNPEEYRDEWDISTTSVSRPVEEAHLRVNALPDRAVDSFGPVINSAGVRFDPPLERDTSLLQIRITKHKATFPVAHLAYQDAVNSDAFTLSTSGFSLSVPLYAAKLGFSGSLQFQNQTSYWKVVYELLIDFQFGWRANVLDRGLEAAAKEGYENGHGGTFLAADLDAGKPKLRRILDVQDGNPITTPVRLDGNGKVADPEGLDVYITYSIYQEKPFAALGL